MFLKECCCLGAAMEEARKPDAMMENDQTTESLTASMTGNISTLQMSHYYNLSVGYFYLIFKFTYQIVTKLCRPTFGNQTPILSYL